MISSRCMCFRCRRFLNGSSRNLSVVRKDSAGLTGTSFDLVEEFSGGYYFTVVFLAVRSGLLLLSPL